VIGVDARYRRVPFASGVRSMLIIIMLEIEAFIAMEFLEGKTLKL
jgi:hypothetical protein